MSILSPDNSMKLFFLIAPCLYIVNVIISSLFAFKYKDKLYRQNMILWICYTLLSFSQGILSDVASVNLTTKTLIWSFFTFMGMEALSHVIADIFNYKKNIESNVIYYFFGALVSFMLFSTIGQNHFNLAALPAVFFSAWPILRLTPLIQQLKSSSFTKIGFFVCSFLTALHILDFAYAVDKPDLLFPGYLIALILSTGISCFSFAVLIERAIYEVEVKDILHNTSRLAALGGMAAEIAHEVNNPLSILSLNNYQLRQKVENGTLDNEYLIKKLEVFERMTDRINKIVQGLRASYRSTEKDNFTIIDLKDIYDDVRVLCEMRAGKIGANLIFDRITSAVQIECKPVQITQIIQNVINNALDALEHSTDKWVRVSYQIKDNTNIEIYISDSGPGISKENQEKIFSTFFTTKSDGKGTGLGLSISRRFSEEHHGFLRIDPTGHNTTFILGLPLRQSPDPAKTTYTKAS